MTRSPASGGQTPRAADCPVPGTAAGPQLSGKAFFAARFYITFRCNSLCGYCNVWQDDKFKGYEELSLEQAKQALDQLHDLGVSYIDFTGGEPVLYRHIDSVVQYARSLGMRVEITTNGLRFLPHVDGIVPHVDAINVSLDTLDHRTYHQIRGVDAFDRAVDTIHRIRRTGSETLKINSVITQKNLHELPELVRFAQSIRVPVNLSTMFGYFDGQGIARRFGNADRALRFVERGRLPAEALSEAEPAPADQFAVNVDIAERIVGYLYQPFTLVPLHFIRYIRTLDPTAETDCQANKSILTVGPDGRLVLPCYHEFDQSVAWAENYRAAVTDPRFAHVRDHEVGKRDGCRSCTVFPYIGLSFSYHFNKQFLFQAFAEEVIKFKTLFLNAEYPDLVPETHALDEHYRELEQLIEAGLPEPPKCDLLYPFAVANGRLSFCWFQEYPLSEVIFDHLNEHCWGIQQSPHFVIRQFYHFVLPEIRSLARQGVIARNDYLDILGSIYRFQVQWWMWFIGRFFSCTEPVATVALAAELEGFISRVADLLPPRPSSTQARAALFLAACVLGSRPELCARLAPGASSPTELLAAKYLRRAAPPGDWARCGPLFSEAVRRALERPPAGRATLPIGEVRARLSDPAHAADLAAWLLADRRHLYGILDQAPVLRQTETEALVTALRERIDDRTRATVQDWLAAYELAPQGAAAPACALPALVGGR